MGRMATTNRLTGQQIKEVVGRIPLPTAGSPLGSWYAPQLGDISPIPFRYQNPKNCGYFETDVHGAIMFAEAVSKSVGEKFYLLSLQRAYDLTFEDEKFRELITERRIRCREIILKDGAVLPYPTIKKVEEVKEVKITRNGNAVKETKEVKVGYLFCGKSTQTKAQQARALNTIREAKLLQEVPGRNMFNSSICFDNVEQACVSCYWDPLEKELVVDAYPPFEDDALLGTGAGDNCIVALMRTDEGP